METLPEKIVVAVTCETDDLMQNSVQAFLSAKRNHVPGETIVLACIVNNRRASASPKLNQMLKDLTRHCENQDIICEQVVRIELDAGPAIVQIVKDRMASKLYLPTEPKTWVRSAVNRRWGTVIDYCMNNAPHYCEVIGGEENIPRINSGGETGSLSDILWTGGRNESSHASEAALDHLNSNSPVSVVSSHGSDMDRARATDFLLTDPSPTYLMSPAQVQDAVANAVEHHLLLRERSMEALQASSNGENGRRGSAQEKSELLQLLEKERQSLEKERREKETILIKLEETEKQKALREKELEDIRQELEETRKAWEEAMERNRGEEGRRLRVEAELVEERRMRMEERDAADAVMERLKQEKEMIEMAQQPTQCILFPYEELLRATDGFASSLLLGQGGFGKVYLGNIRRTKVAIKKLDLDSLQGEEELKKEVKVLNENRHPHLLSLLGACFERQCIVFEYMEGGSLQDKLDRRNGQPPLPWIARLRILYEVATGLHFLHTARPQIIHRDIKPANILLDSSGVSKISDTGLARIANMANNVSSTMSLQTMGSKLTGTFHYLDPEYINFFTYSAKSDVFALGVVMAQLLSGQSDPGQAKQRVISKDQDGNYNDLKSIVDNSGGAWEKGIAEDFVEVIRRCCALERAARMDLDTLISALENLRARAEVKVQEREARFPGVDVESMYPELFIDPISWEVMEDPVLLADGHNYERATIQAWLAMSNTSPLTNEPLSDARLIPNYDLRSKIMEWREQMARRALSRNSVSSAQLSS